MSSPTPRESGAQFASQELIQRAENRRLRRLVRSTALGLGVFMCALVVALALQGLGIWGLTEVQVCLLVGAALGCALGASLHEERTDQRRLALAQTLVQAGHGKEALPLLKGMAAESPKLGVQDTICYLTARAYEQQGAVKLALAYYRDYGKRFPEGAWALEVKTHVAELRRTERQRRALNVEALPPVGLRCPYCHEDVELGKTGVEECVACGTRAHADCTREHGGCAVFGCAQAAPAATGAPAARERA